MNRIEHEELSVPVMRVWLALLSLLCLPLATANAQGCSPGDSTAIIGTTVDAEDLIVTTAWQSAMALAWFEVAVFDENDLQIAGQLVWPIPGQPTQTTFGNFLEGLPQGGFQFSAEIRDTAGQSASPQHSFRTIMHCPGAAEPCGWATQDGVYTNALAISQPLLNAVDAAKATGSSHLLADVLAQQPELRGSVFTLAAQLDQLDQQLDLRSECFCAWFHSFSRSPGVELCGQYGPGKSFDESWGWERLIVEGVGTATRAAGQSQYSETSPEAIARGSVSQTMKLSCWKVEEWTAEVPLPLPISGTQPPTIRVPRLEACEDSCRGVVKSSATVDYQLSSRTHEPAWGSGSSAIARAEVGGLLISDNLTSQTSTTEAWDACRQRPPEDGCTSASSGQIQTPAGGIFEDSNTQGVTVTLSGNATVSSKAKLKKAWSYAKSCFDRVQVRTKGEAACAVQPTSEALLSSSTTATPMAPASGAPATIDCGDLQIEPWG